MTTEFEPWEVVEAFVPFEDISGKKKRPVVVLSETEAIVFSLKMTSHEPRYKTLEGEYELMHWQEAGLVKPTVVQCRKRLQLGKDAFTGRKFGKLTLTDILGLQYMIKYMKL